MVKNEKLKNCKNISDNGEKCVKLHNKSSQNAENSIIFTFNNERKNPEYDTKMKAYAKTLLIIYPTIPNIIKIVDSMVEKRASSSISLSSIYSGTDYTYKQMEKMIDLTERKCKLLNIFSLIKELLEPMSTLDYEVVNLKFFRRKKIADIAESLSIDERSVYRRINKILDSIVKHCNLNLITLSTIEGLVKGEGWIKEIFNKSMEEIKSNKVRSEKNVKKREE